MAGGFLGFFLASLVSITSLLAVLVLLSRRLSAGPISTLAGLLITLMAGLSFLSPRATVAAQALFLGSVAFANWWRHLAVTRGLRISIGVIGGASVGFSASGSWLHLSWMMFAPAMALSWAVLWGSTPALGRRRMAALTLTGLAGSCLGLLAGPYGTDVWALSRQVQTACSGLVTEWVGMFTPGIAGRWAAVGIAAILGAFAGLVWGVRHWSSRAADSRVGLVLALLVVALPASLGGLTAVRFIGVALLGLSPLAAMAAAAGAKRLRRRMDEPQRGVFLHSRVRFWADGKNWRPVLVAVPVLLLPGTAIMTAPLGRPLQELAVSERLPHACHLLSDPGSAAPVILLRPDVKVWIDGRADYYGRDRNMQAIHVLNADRTNIQPLEQATCVVLRLHAQFDVRSLVAALDKDPHWRRSAHEGDIVAWVRS